jgi:hypothetical protein
VRHVRRRANDSTYGLTFTGVSPFDVFTDASGTATNIPLGTFSRATSTSRNRPPRSIFRSR